MGYGYQQVVRIIPTNGNKVLIMQRVEPICNGQMGCYTDSLTMGRLYRNVLVGVACFWGLLLSYDSAVSPGDGNTMD